MCNRTWLVVGLVGVMAMRAWGAFVPPTDNQLIQAAEDPARIGALVKQASVAQAAEVTKNVIVKIVGLGLPPVTRNARVAAIIADVFKAMPGKAKALAAALGRAIAASPVASGDPAVVSTIQQAVIAAAGAEGSAAGAAFGNAYNMAMQSVAGAPGGGKVVPPTPPPPPVAIPYEGQSLR